MMQRRSFLEWPALAALAIAATTSFSCTDALAPSYSVHRIFQGRRPALLDNTLRSNSHKLWMSAASSSQTSSWIKLTVPQLKSQLKEWNLPVSGVKADLIQRLEDYQASPDAAVTAEPETSIPNKQQTTSRKRLFPPAKGETEIQVAEKEVQETVRMLEGLKLSNGNKVGVDSQQQQPADVASRQLTKQQKQEKKMMASLKQSLKQSQQQKNNPQETKDAEQQQASPEQLAHAEKLQHYVEQLRVKPANDLKVELVSMKMSTKGRKPDLVQRLAEYYVSRDADGYEEGEESDETAVEIPDLIQPSSTLDLETPMSFAGISRLSANAANALHQAFVGEDTTTDPKPTPIQSVAISKLFYPPNPSALLHAPTGSGKTIAYLLPITETLWKEVEQSKTDNVDVNDMGNGVALVLLPTRELAAQVAGVATVLAPPGMVKLVPRPVDLMSFWKEEVDHGEEFEYNESEGNETGEGERTGRKYQPRILVGSAKSISTSLFGDKKMPGTPTNKPQGKQLLSSTRWLVMDEVDRLLDIKKTRTDRRSRHEKPAALLAAAIARLTVGRVQVIAASATVGRPLRRELSRVLGLHSSECPETLRGGEDTANLEERIQDADEVHVGRAVKIPATVKNYVLPVDGSTTGSLLTSASFAAKSILTPAQDSEVSGRKVLLVITRNCDIKVHNALGALRHFGIQPEPQSLLDALEADGTDRLVEAHRKVSGVEGVGGAKQPKGTPGSEDEEGYLLVTHEDNVRGLHLDGLDAVIVVGRPGSPDEYTHIAGRTGRAGRNGSVLNIVSFEQAAALASWTKMLGVDFLPVDEGEVAGIIED